MSKRTTAAKATTTTTTTAKPEVKITSWIPSDKCKGSIQVDAFPETGFQGVVEVNKTKNDFYFAKCIKDDGGYMNLPASNLIQQMENKGIAGVQEDKDGQKAFILNVPFTAKADKEWKLEIII